MLLYEQLVYLLRLPIILFSVIIIAILLGIAIPELEDTHVEADVFASRIAYGGMFGEQPGIVEETLWSQDRADLAITYFQKQTPKQAVGVAGAASLEDLQGNELLQPIQYNKEQYRNLIARAGTRGISTTRYALPVTYVAADGTQSHALLKIEVVGRE